MARAAHIEQSDLARRTATKPESATDTEGVPAALIVGAIALLVVLVSLPRFRAHVLRANRLDATTTLDVLGAVIFADEWQSAIEPGAAPLHLPGVIEADERLSHRFPDARRALAADGRVELLHHGYLFDTGHVMDGAFRRPALVAWPAEFGKSGDAAYARTRDGAVWGHQNGGLWSGTADALMDADLSDEGWRRLR